MKLNSYNRTTLIAMPLSIMVTFLAAGLLFISSANILHAQEKQASEAAMQDTDKADTSPADFSGSQRKAIEKILREYLIQNPEILMEMSRELERRQIQAQNEELKKIIGENADAIFRGENAFVAGNPEGDVTLVEFFDYNCPYCRRAVPTIARLIESDSKLRLVLKEFPVFGENSVGAARVAIAASKQGKYFKFHSELLKSPGQATEAKALQTAEKLGLDMDKLKQDMSEPEVEKIITETRQLADKLGVQATPFFLVGDRPITGAPDNLYELIVQNIAEIRKEGCSVPC